MKDSEIFFKCALHEKGMLVTRREDKEEFCFSYCELGVRKMTLSQRIRSCLKVLWTGKTFEDEIILDEDNAGEMAVWINSEINKIQLERRLRELQSTVRPRTDPPIRKWD